jgi:hypothetical protein
MIETSTAFAGSNGNTKHEQNRKQQANKDSSERNLTNAGSENRTNQVLLHWVATKDKPEWNPTNASVTLAQNCYR